MKAFLLFVLVLMVGFAWVTLYGPKTARSLSDSESAGSAGYRDPVSLKKYVDRLTSDGRNWRQHGVYVETLESAEPVAMLNEEAEFNPASVIKLATTLA